MTLERIRCTKCGGDFDEYDESKSEYRCSRIGCGATFIVRQAKEFAKTEIDHAKDIQNLRQLLDQDLNRNDIGGMAVHAMDIRRLVPDDFIAGFCDALFQKKQGRLKDYYDFLKKKHEFTDDERDQALDTMLASAHFSMHDVEAIHLYIEMNYPADQQEDKKHALNQAIGRLSEDQSRFAHVPCDVFICHSSSDEKIALEVYDMLRKDGNTCWISGRNLPPETIDYWDEITGAISRSKIILVISSGQCMLRKDPIREMDIAIQYKLKRLELKIDDTEHTEYFKYFFDGKQWIKMTADKEEAYRKLRERVCLLLHTGIAGPAKPKPVKTAAKDAQPNNREPVAPYKAQQEIVQTQPDSWKPDTPATTPEEKNGSPAVPLREKGDAGETKMPLPEKVALPVVEKPATEPARAAVEQHKAPAAPTKAQTAVQKPVQASADEKARAALEQKRKVTLARIGSTRTRLGKWVTSILTLAWLASYAVVYIGHYGVLSRLEYELPVVRDLYNIVMNVFYRYRDTSGILENSNPASFIALMGTVCILIASVPFGVQVIDRAARKLTFWLILELAVSAYYRLMELSYGADVIFQDKVVAVWSFTLHIWIAVAISITVHFLFRKAGVRSAEKQRKILSMERK